MKHQNTKAVNNLVVGFTKQIFVFILLVVLYSPVGLSRNYTKFYQDNSTVCDSSLLADIREDPKNRFFVPNQRQVMHNAAFIVSRPNGTKKGNLHISKFRLFFSQNLQNYSFTLKYCQFDVLNASLFNDTKNRCALNKLYSSGNITNEKDYELDITMNLNATKYHVLIFEGISYNNTNILESYYSKNQTTLNRFPNYEFNIAKYTNSQTLQNFQGLNGVYFLDVCYRYTLEGASTNHTLKKQTTGGKSKTVPKTTGKKTDAPKTEATKGKNTEATKDGKKTDAPKTEATEGKKTDKTKQKPKPETKPNTKKKANPTKKNSAFTLTTGKPIYLLGLVTFLGLL